MENNNIKAATTNGEKINGEKKEETVMNIEWNPVPFTSIGETMITDTEKLSMYINDYMNNTFSDYSGSTIMMEQSPVYGRVLSPILFFKILPRNQYDFKHNVYGFSPNGTSNSEETSTVLDRVMSVTHSAVSGRSFEATKEFKSIMKNFVIGNPNNIKWSDFYSQTVYNNEVYARVYRLDMMKLLKVLYGDKDENGADLYYQITPTHPIRYQQYGAKDVWSAYILRVNNGVIQDVAASQGLFYSNNNSCCPFNSSLSH